MMHHTFQSLPLAPFAPFSHLDQWAPSWPDVYAFSKSDSRLSRPHPYSTRRRPPYPRLEATSGLSPRSPRTGAPPVLRTQVPPMLSALPIPMATLGLERELVSFLLWYSVFTQPCQHPLCPPPPTPDRRCPRLLRRHLRRSFSKWCATRHYWHPSRFHIDHRHFLTVLSFLTQMRISHAPLTRDRVPSGSVHVHETDRTSLLWFQSAAPQSLSSVG